MVVAHHYLTFNIPFGVKGSYEATDSKGNSYSVWLNKFMSEGLRFVKSADCLEWVGIKYPAGRPDNPDKIRKIILSGSLYKFNFTRTDNGVCWECIRKLSDIESQKIEAWKNFSSYMKWSYWCVEQSELEEFVNQVHFNPIKTEQISLF